MADLKTLREDFQSESQAASSTAELDLVRVKFVGRKGLVTAQMKLISTLPPEERKGFGQSVNELKKFVESGIAARREELKSGELKKKLATETLDASLPGHHTPYGTAHPITQTLQEIVDIFTRMGFGVEEGPEVELDHYNFEALNIPKDHPARDMQDTFYITPDSVLRTHTSPVQIRVMERVKPPLRIIAPGKVYRCDADVSHTPMFHQVEGLMVGEDISFSHLKGILEAFIHEMFGPDIPVRFRPSFFPFTEPSAEVDMGCIFCDSKGCRVCQNCGWIEILGSGMVNPKVFEMVYGNADAYSGFAFGMGVERIAMLKYSIDDIRLFYENDLRFLKQF